MTVHRDHSLKSFNTFGVEARAAHFATAENLDTLQRLLPAPCLGEVPNIAPWDPSIAAKSLSIKGLLG